MHTAVYTYTIGLHSTTLQQSLLSSWSPLSFILAKTNHHQHSAKLIELVSSNHILTCHLPYLSINTWLSTYLLFPAQFMTEDLPFQIRCCGCVKALLPPTTTPCSSALWQRLVDGMRLLFSGLTGKAWIPISVPRWLSLTIPFDWRALCRRPTGFPSAYQPATFTKPLACLTRHKSSITRTNASWCHLTNA